MDSAAQGNTDKNNSQTPSSVSVSPSGTGNKEVEIPRKTDYVSPSEPEAKIENDLINAGVSAVSDKPKLDEVHEKIGVHLSAESTPVKTEPSGVISLPMTEDDADRVISESSSKFHLQENVGEFAGEYTEDSLPFFASLIKKIFKEMHRRVLGKK